VHPEIQEGLYVEPSTVNALVPAPPGTVPGDFSNEHGRLPGHVPPILAEIARGIR